MTPTRATTMAEYEKLYRENVDGIRDGAGDELVGHCPFHPDKRRSFSANKTTGLYFCHAGCGGGNAESFCKRRGIDPAQYQIPDKSTQVKKGIIHGEDLQAKSKQHTSYLMDHWDELMPSFSWKKEWVEKTLTGYDPSIQSDTYTITDTAGQIQAIHYHRGHFVGDGKSTWWPAHLLETFDRSKPLYVVEGEKDTNTMLSYCGQTITNTTGASNQPKDFTPIEGFKCYIVIYDNDKAGREGAMAMAKKLIHHFPDSEVKIVYWKKDDPEHWDVTDLLSNKRSTAELDQMIDRAITITPPKRGYTTMKADDMEKMSFEKPSAIIDQLLYKNGVLSIAGTDGVGKSMLALQLAISVSLGVPFLEHFEVSQPVRTLLVQFELSEGDLTHRYQQQKRYFMNKYPDLIGNYDNLSFTIIGTETKLFQDQWQMIRETLEENNFHGGLLIVDNMYSSTDIDVSDNTQLGSLLSVIHLLKNQFDLTLLLVNHHNKGTHKEKELSKDQIRGGKTFTDYISNCLQICDSSMSESLRVAKITKLRSGESQLRNIPFKLKFNADTLTFSYGCIISKESLHFVETKSRNEIKAIVEIESDTVGGTFDRSQFLGVIDGMGFSPKTCDNWLKRLIGWGIIVKEKYNDYKIIGDLSEYKD